MTSIQFKLRKYLVCHHLQHLSVFIRLGGNLSVKQQQQQRWGDILLFVRILTMPYRHQHTQQTNIRNVVWNNQNQMEESEMTAKKREREKNSWSNSNAHSFNHSYIYLSLLLLLLLCFLFFFLFYYDVVGWWNLCDIRNMPTFHSTNKSCVNLNMIFPKDF